VTTVDGAIQVTGTNITDGTGRAIGMDSSANIGSTGTGTVTLIGDSIDLIFSATITAGSNAVTLRQKTNGRPIALNSGEPFVGNLGLSSEDLNSITAGQIVVGNANSGVITFKSVNLTLTSSSILHLITPSTVGWDGSGYGGDAAFVGTSLIVEATGGMTGGGSTQFTTEVSNLAGTASSGTFRVHNIYRSALAVASLAGINGISVTNASVSLTEEGTTQTLTVSAPITATGTGSVSLESDFVTLNAAVTTNSGAVNVNSQFSSNASGTITTTSGPVTLSGTYGSATGAINHGSGGTTFNAGSGALGTFGGAISGSGGITVNGSDGDTVEPLTLSAASSYTGSTIIKSGSIKLSGGADRLPTGTTVTLGTVSSGTAGTLKLNGNNQTIAGLQTASGNSGTNRVVNGNATAAALTVNLASGFQDLSGILGGTGTNDNNFSLVKQGSGSFGLSGANTYTGTTSVNAGTLLVNGSIANGSAATDVTVASSATLGGTGTISGTVDVQSGGTVAPGTSPGILTTGSVTMTSGATLGIEINGTTVGTDYDRLSVIGTAALGNATLSPSGTHTPVSGNTFTILTTTSALSGTFNGLADGATLFLNSQPLEIDYDPKNVVLTFDATPVINAGAGNNGITVREDAGGNLEVVIDSVTVLDTPLSGLTSLTINGEDGDDTLTVDYSFAGGFFNLPITFNGGNQTGSPGDTLVINDPPGTATTVTHTFTSASAGSVNIDGTAISYTGLEPVTDNVSATNRVFTFTGGAETITVTDGTAADGMTMIDSTLGESVSFTNPTGSLTINAGTGDDTVTVTSVDAGYTVDLTINGDAGSDTVNLNGSITFADDENLDVNLTNDASGGDVDQVLVSGGAVIATSGTGSINLQGSRLINVVGAGTTLSTVNGGITLIGNAAGTTAGNFIGVRLGQGGSASIVRTTGTGNITVIGKGGNDATMIQHLGVHFSGGVVESTASGLGSIKARSPRQGPAGLVPITKMDLQW
jgi:autotransporter-associated beta strand protein